MVMESNVHKLLLASIHLEQSLNIGGEFKGGIASERSFHQLHLNDPVYSKMPPFPFASSN
jgi:hypothetical protein